MELFTNHFQYLNEKRVNISAKLSQQDDQRACWKNANKDKVDLIYIYTTIIRRDIKKDVATLMSSAKLLPDFGYWFIFMLDLCIKSLPEGI